MLAISARLSELGMITFSNRHVTSSLHYHEEELIGQNISALIPQVFKDVHDGLLRAYLYDSPDRD